MPEKPLKTDFPVIDTDPHFFRVVRYFRPSDYAWWGGTTLGGPAYMIAFERMSPSIGLPGVTRAAHITSLKYATFLGLVGGFFHAYLRSSFRFWGWKENSREYDRDMKEMRQRLKEGKPLWGESSLPPYLQRAAAAQSRYSAVNLVLFPFFNFANHPYHGVDPKKYEVKEEQEYLT
ncbi:hypothetical protein G9A89_008052 [Geosiphon pyriformis]|nr:hypothetical protein G9A89_008052 [Geosiphon pyriformis]